MDKRQNFVRLAEARTAKAMQAIRLIGNLSNRSNYSFNDDEIRKISRTLHAEIDSMISRFQNSESKSRPSFKLGER
jgi:hypothetical protein